jgi:hypothetical protein
VSVEGIQDFGDEDFDPLPFEVHSLVARHERRKFIRKRRETNRQKTKQGVKASGYAAFGYEWLSILKLHLRGEKEASVGRYEVVPQEYTIVEEIFARILKDGGAMIAEDFNRRWKETGKPLPPVRADCWRMSTIMYIVHNPLYAGYPASRIRLQRGGKRMKLAAEQWTMPQEVGDYAHPVTLEEWQEIQQVVGQRASKSGVKTARARTALLTGLLYCSNGRPMQKGTNGYRCNCAREGNKHAGACVRDEGLDAAAFEAFRRILEVLPDDLLQSKPITVNKVAIRAEYNKTLRTVQELEAQSYTLMTYQEENRKLFGEEEFRRACVKNRAVLETERSRLKELQSQLSAPDWTKAYPAFRRMREGGIEAIWPVATIREQRELLHLLITRFQIIAPTRAGRHTRSVSVMPSDEAKRFCKQMTVTIPKRSRWDNQEK